MYLFWVIGMLTKLFGNIFSKKELHIEAGAVLVELGAVTENIVRLLHDVSYRTPIKFNIGKYELTGGLLSDAVYLDIFDKGIQDYDKSRCGRVHVRAGSKILEEKPYRIHCCHSMKTYFSESFDSFEVKHLIQAIDSLIPGVLEEVSRIYEETK